MRVGPKSSLELSRVYTAHIGAASKMHTSLPKTGQSQSRIDSNITGDLKQSNGSTATTLASSKPSLTSWRDSQEVNSTSESSILEKITNGTSSYLKIAHSLNDGSSTSDLKQSNAFTGTTLPLPTKMPSWSDIQDVNSISESSTLKKLECVGASAVPDTTKPAHARTASTKLPSEPNTNSSSSSTKLLALAECDSSVLNSSKPLEKTEPDIQPHTRKSGAISRQDAPPASEDDSVLTQPPVPASKPTNSNNQNNVSLLPCSVDLTLDTDTDDDDDDSNDGNYVNGEHDTDSSRDDDIHRSIVPSEKRARASPSPSNRGSQDTGSHPTLAGTKRKATNMQTKTADIKGTATSATAHTQTVCTFKSVDLTLDSSSDEDDDDTLVTKDVKPSHLLRDADLDPLRTNVSRGAQLSTDTDQTDTSTCDTKTNSSKPKTLNMKNPSELVFPTEKRPLPCPPLQSGDVSAITEEPSHRLTGTKRKQFDREETVNHATTDNNDKCSAANPTPPITSPPSVNPVDLTLDDSTEDEDERMNDDDSDATIPRSTRKAHINTPTAFHANLANDLTTIETNSTNITAHSLFRKSTGVNVNLDVNVNGVDTEAEGVQAHRKLLASRLPVIQLPSATQPSEILARDECASNDSVRTPNRISKSRLLTSAASLVQSLPSIPSSGGSINNSSSPIVISATVGTLATDDPKGNDKSNKHAPKDAAKKEPTMIASKPASNNDSLSIKPAEHTRGTSNTEQDKTETAEQTTAEMSASSPLEVPTSVPPTLDGENGDQTNKRAVLAETIPGTPNATTTLRNETASFSANTKADTPNETITNECAAFSVETRAGTPNTTKTNECASFTAETMAGNTTPSATKPKPNGHGSTNTNTSKTVSPNIPNTCPVKTNIPNTCSVKTNTPGKCQSVSTDAAIANPNSTLKVGERTAVFENSNQPELNTPRIPSLIQLRPSPSPPDTQCPNQSTENCAIETKPNANDEPKTQVGRTDSKISSFIGLNETSNPSITIDGGTPNMPQTAEEEGSRKRQKNLEPAAASSLPQRHPNSGSPTSDSTEPIVPPAADPQRTDSLGSSGNIPQTTEEGSSQPPKTLETAASSLPNLGRLGSPNSVSTEPIGQPTPDKKQTDSTGTSGNPVPSSPLRPSSKDLKVDNNGQTKPVTRHPPQPEAPKPNINPVPSLSPSNGLGGRTNSNHDDDDDNDELVVLPSAHGAAVSSPPSSPELDQVTKKLFLSEDPPKQPQPQPHSVTHPHKPSIHTTTER
mmetsp:Transcript_58116/g.69939  ORF Transcript_58116/g.69939 Transcript_58116/m.69939 type:complete len:1258 (+) Transcript_58116:3-3776(+)